MLVTKASSLWFHKIRETTIMPTVNKKWLLTVRLAYNTDLQAEFKIPLSCFLLHVHIKTRSRRIRGVWKKWIHIKSSDLAVANLKSTQRNIWVDAKHMSRLDAVLSKWHPNVLCYASLVVYCVPLCKPCVDAIYKNDQKICLCQIKISKSVRILSVFLMCHFNYLFCDSFGIIHKVQ